MIIAAASMQSSGLTLFALLTLVAGVALGLNRAALLQPALLYQRRESLALVPFRYAMVSTMLGVALIGASSIPLGVHNASEIGLLAISSGFPLLADWARFRRIAADQRWRVAFADAIRLALVVAAIPFWSLTQDAIAFQVYLSSSSAVSLICLLWGFAPIRLWTPYKSYAKAARLQVVDFLVGQVNSTLPLFVLGALGPSTLIAGVRLAQTLFGPLNLVASASVMHLLADGATRDSHSTDTALIKAGRRLSASLGATSAAYLLCAAVIASLPFAEFSAVSADTFTLAIFLVGSVALVSGWSGIHSIILRLLNEQVVATLGRVVLVVGSLTGFSIGFVFGGVDASIVSGFLTSVVLYPIVFIVPAEIIYRKRLKL
ncbi:hypothetical protein B0I08_11243 [Glaciihabitans tibetensis]|uniref:O-antigen/teichoic acid export membrane protein n=1 Tax=Glaciihabitans tibetensis TaxID=1266600 RepID=A0A2T0V3M3_9MICO|nr:hypothetical protein [Glaciihabitans tibetensis]PRY64658.1 hypothetical protein B0I08_11243 [Glaciihabitans tibetensis]